MKRLHATFFAVLLVLFAFGRACPADTFVHRQTDEVLHGYTTSQVEDGKTTVHTRQKGKIELNLAEWKVTPDRSGRNSEVIILPVNGNIMLQIETEALMDAIDKAVNSGPLFILLEIDTPGGRIDYTRRICGAIAQTGACQVVAFVRGGQYGGAISAGAAVAFACDKIYMAESTSIGASAPVGLSGNRIKDFNQIYGPEVAEKINSAWRTYLASLAEQNDRPGLLAGAMVDESIEVIEVSEADKRLFIDPVNVKPEQKIVHTWSKKGSLLTLTADEAARCGIADEVLKSRLALLRHLQATEARLVIDDAFQQAHEQFKRAEQRFNKISKSLDLKIKQFKRAETQIRAVKMLREIRDGYKSLAALAKLYPDLQVDVNYLNKQLNSAEALYEQEKMKRRFRP